MTRDEIKKWVEAEILPRHKSDKVKPLAKKISELIKIAMEKGEVPGWLVSNMLTSLSEKHGYR